MPTPRSARHQYGPHFLNRFDYYRNGTVGGDTPVGGRPWILICPFSGYTAGSTESVRLSGQIHQDFIDYFLDPSRPMPYEMFVCDVNQSEPRTFSAETPWPNERTMHFPDNVALVARCFQYIRSHPLRWTGSSFAGHEINPDKGVLYGTSAGATYAMLVAYRASAPYFRRGYPMPLDRYPAMASSTPAAVVNRNGQTNWIPNDVDAYLDNGPLLEQFLGIPSELADPDELSDEVFRAISPVAYVTASSPPTIQVYPTPPGSPPTPPYTDPHDPRLGDDLKAALDAAGVVNALHKDNGASPDGNQITQQNLARIYTFLQANLGFT